MNKKENKFAVGPIYLSIVIITLLFLLMTISPYYTFGTQTVKGILVGYRTNTWPFISHEAILATGSSIPNTVSWLNGNFTSAVSLNETCIITTTGWNLTSYNCT